MSNKYVATIMDRHYIGENAFVFNCNHAVIGDFDEETGIFRDRNGNEYAPMTSPRLMESEIPYAFSNVIRLDDIQEEIGGGLSLKDSISEYEYICKKRIFFVRKTKEDNIFCIHFNMDEIEGQVKEASEEEEYMEDDGAIDPALRELIIDVINGKYSLNELKQIKNQLISSYEDFEWAIDTIDLQIEATENGTSLIDLPPDPEGLEEYEDKRKPRERNYYDVFDELFSDERIDIEKLFQQVTRTLIAQDEPARRVIAEIARKELDERKKKEGILLTGSTGVGKTELMRLIAKYLNKPFCKVDSNQLTTPGYTGKDIEEVLWDFYVSCGRDKNKVENAIIFFDEIDKKGSSRKDDHSGQGVLNLLLPFIEGTTYDACEDMRHGKEKVKIDTSNMIVILGGAYTDVYKKLVEKNIGFNREVSSKPVYRPATTQDFIEKGMMTDEFMGRVTVIKMNDLDVDDIKRIMLESDQSAMRVQEEIFKKLGVKITFTDSYTTAIAKDAKSKGTGARGLNGIIDESTWRAFDEVYCHNGMYEEVILDEKTVHNPNSFQLVKKKGH